MGLSAAATCSEKSHLCAETISNDIPALGTRASSVAPDIRAAGNLAVQRLRRSGCSVNAASSPTERGAASSATGFGAPAAVRAQASVLDDVVQGASDVLESLEETATDIVKTGEEAVQGLIEMGKSAVAAVTAPGGVVIPIPDIPLIDRACYTFPWSGSTGNIPFYDEVIDVPDVGPVTITLYVRGDALASLAACVGPVRLQNIRVVLDPLASRYSGTAQLFAPAGLTGGLTLVGSIGGVADWLGLVEIAAVEGSLIASGTGLATSAFIATAEILYDRGDVSFALDTELDSCLSLMVGFDATARATLLSTPVWSGSWRLFGWTWERCWRLGASLSIEFVGGVPTLSVDLSAEELPVSELLHELLADSGLISALTPTVPVPVVILGSGELWWFDGERPPTYPVDQALLATAAGLPGTFRWEIVSGVTFADFNGFPTAVGPTALLTSKSPSAGGQLQHPGSVRHHLASERPAARVLVRQAADPRLRGNELAELPAHGGIGDRKSRRVERPTCHGRRRAFDPRPHTARTGRWRAPHPALQRRLEGGEPDPRQGADRAAQHVALLPGSRGSPQMTW